MTISLTDKEIDDLLGEAKVLPKGFEQKLKLKPKRGHKEAEVDIEGTKGNRFRLILRKSRYNPLDFSVIVGYLPSNTNVVFRLRRYNGSSHDHKNRLEDQLITGFHIHMATERYQDLGVAEDSYAESSDRYSNLDEAIRCAMEDCNIRPEDANQSTLQGVFR